MSATERRLTTPPQQSVEPLVVSVREASRALGVGRDATYQLIREGRLRAIHVGRVIRIPRTELVAFVEREASSGDTFARD